MKFLIQSVYKAKKKIQIQLGMVLSSFQYFNIFIYIKSVKIAEINCSLKSPPDCAELHSLPYSVVQ